MFPWLLGEHEVRSYYDGTPCPLPPVPCPYALSPIACPLMTARIRPRKTSRLNCSA